MTSNRDSAAKLLGSVLLVSTGAAGVLLIQFDTAPNRSQSLNFE